MKKYNGWCVFFGLICITVLRAEVMPVGKNANELVFKVPVQTVEPALLEVTVFRPPGVGPFPTVLINHGKSVGAAREQARARYYLVSREFVRRGFQVVLPMRRGFSASQGRYRSFACDITASALNQASDITDVLQWLKQQRMISTQPVVLIGQSFGGLASLAAATKGQISIALVVNFAGGLKISSASPEPCDWQSALLQSVRYFGEVSKTPGLWFYGENDRYFSSDLVRLMHTYYEQAGGLAELHLYSAFKQDAHQMFGDMAGFSIWFPIVLQHLKTLGFDVEPKYVLGTLRRPVSSGYAAIEDTNTRVLQGLTDSTAYANFLKRQPPRAFAIGERGQWAWVSGPDEAVQDTLRTCYKNSGAQCRLYAVDEDVVWSNNN